MLYTNELTHWRNEAKYQLSQLRLMNTDIKNIAIVKSLVGKSETLFSLRVNCELKIDERSYPTRYQYWQCVEIVE